MERKRKLDLPTELENNNTQNKHTGNEGGSAVNPYTGRPYTSRYYDILAGRKGRWKNERLHASNNEANGLICICRSSCLAGEG